MFESLEGVDAIKNGLESSERLSELSESQIAYLKELNMPAEQWEELAFSSKSACLSAIEARFEELGISDNSVIESTLQNHFSAGIVESYHDI